MGGGHRRAWIEGRPDIFKVTNRYVSDCEVQ